MQSIRDVRLNSVPQADYSFLSDQLEKLEVVVKDLPRKMEETFQSTTSNKDFQVFLGPLIEDLFVVFSRRIILSNFQQSHLF